MAYARRRFAPYRRAWVGRMARAGVPWQALPDGPEKREAYYLSPEWQAVWWAVWRRCGGRCESCRRRAMRQAHHLVYTWLYSEMAHLETLQGVCFKCHANHHNKPGEHDRSEGWEGAAGALSQLAKVAGFLLLLAAIFWVTGATRF